MERETTKHSRRLDDAMAGDVSSLTHGAPVESRAQEARLQEDPEVDAGRRADADEAVGLGISPSDADRRAELARHLAQSSFPARRDDLVAAAEAGFAPSDVVESLLRLPTDQQYDSVQAVWTALGGKTEQPHTRT